MISVSVKHTLKNLPKKLNRMQRRDLPKVVVSALNKTVGNVKVAVAKDITKSTGIVAGKVKPHLIVVKASIRKPTASITSSKRTFNLIRFASPIAIRNYRKDGGLKAKAWGKKVRVFPGTFVGNKGRTAFIRTGEGRGIRPAHGPSIPRAMVSDSVARNTRLVTARRWRINFAHAFKRKFERVR